MTLAILLNQSLIELGVKYLPAGLIAIFITGFIVLTILGKLSDVLQKFKTIFKKKTKVKKLNQKEQTIENLIHHQFFYFIDFAIKYRIPKMKFQCPVRTVILQKFLTYKCQVFYRRTKDLVDLDINTISIKTLEKIVLTDILDGIKEYETLIKKEGVTAEERLVLDIIVNRFSAWHDKNVEAAYKVIENIFDSNNIYHNNIERMNGVLNVYLFAFVSAFTDAEKALYNINGEISGKIYRGQKII